MPAAKRILITGAAGIVGRAIRPLMAKQFSSLLLTDLQPIDDLAENESFAQGDLQDASFVDSLFSSDVDGVVHLGGLVGPDFEYDEVIRVNVTGTYLLLDAAARHGTRSFVYASSHHAVGFLPRGSVIDSQTPHRPDSFYGISKAMGETLATYYADKHGLNVLAIRIGFVGDEVIDERRMHTWCSAADLSQLIRIGLTHDNLGYRVVYGVSNNPDCFFDNAEAIALGYQPSDRALDHLADESLNHQQPDLSLLENRLVGGYFGARGFRGDPDRLAQGRPEEPRE